MFKFNRAFPTLSDRVETLIREDQVAEARERGYLIEVVRDSGRPEYHAATPAYVARLTERGTIHRFR